MWRVPVNRQPHEPPETHVTLPEEYTCQWLDTMSDLPPPIRRANGGFVLRQTDCDGCNLYAAAVVAPASGQDEPPGTGSADPDLRRLSA